MKRLTCQVKHDDGHYFYINQSRAPAHNVANVSQIGNENIDERSRDSFSLN